MIIYSVELWNEIVSHFEFLIREGLHLKASAVVNTLTPLLVSCSSVRSLRKVRTTLKTLYKTKI